MIQQQRYFNTPPVVLNLLIINVLVYLAQLALPVVGNIIGEYLPLYYIESERFRIYQFLTHMFLHGGHWHLFTNMFALWMFGRVLEYDLGSRRFLIFYLVCGMGAALFYMGVNWLELLNIKANLAANPELSYLALAKMNTATVGASGAVFGILLAFGMLHPNARIMLLFPPIPMRAKYFVIIYGVVELVWGIGNGMGLEFGGNIAHFAHVGGMLWGYILLRWWKYKRQLFY